MQQKQAKVEIRCSFEEKSAWQEAAGGARQVSRWARETLNRAAEELAGAVEKADESAVQVRPPAPLDRIRVEQNTTSVAAPSGKCPRWMHHRPGVYCGTCKKVSK